MPEASPLRAWKARVSAVQAWNLGLVVAAG